MKKFALLAIVAAFTVSMVGCGGAPTTKPAGAGSTEVKKTEETKKN